MDKDYPKISIIIPNYNDIRIDRCLKSIYKQNYNNYEIILVDGKSSNELVFEIYKKYNINKLIIERDNGIFDAINKGLKYVTGDIILLIGSDDYLYNESTFKAVAKEFRCNALLDIVSIECIYINNKKKISRIWNIDNINAKEILKGNLPPHFSLFIKKRIYNKTGQFEIKNNDFAEDSIWLVKMALLNQNIKIKALKGYFTIMESGGTSNANIINIIMQNMKLYKWLKINHISRPVVFIIRKIMLKVKQIRFNIKTLDEMKILQ
jgi:glycosyltransferase involved in cell wall biosynthesis